MEWFEAEADWIWLVAAVALAGVELLTLDLVFLMLAVAAAAAGLGALLGLGLAWQLGLFIAVGLLMLAAVRPVALRHLRKDTGAGASYLDGLPGRRLTADGAITAESGLLDVDGDTWTARVEPGTEPVAAGAPLTVVRVAGATLVVRALPRIDWDSAGHA